MRSARVGIPGGGGRARGPPLRHGEHGRGALRTVKEGGRGPPVRRQGHDRGPDSGGEFALQFLLYGLGNTSRLAVADPLSVDLDDGIGPEGRRGEKDFFGGEELFDGEGTL